MNSISNKKIFITGGTGSLGQALVKHFLPLKPKEIIIYSRGEHKQSNMEKMFPECFYYLGDVRDYERLKMAMRGVDIVIHAAALKVVPKGETDPIEFVNTNIGGAKNVIQAAIHNDVKKVIAVSTDKACDPLNLYGATKLCSDKMFQAANAYQRHGTPEFVVVRYGNILGSQGSVVPLFMKQAKKRCFTITDPNMTRFIFTLEEACNLIIKAINNSEPGEIHIAKCKSMKVKDIADAVEKYYNYVIERKIIGIRPGEKINECLNTETNYYSHLNSEWMSVDELVEWITKTYGPPPKEKNTI